LRRFRNTSRVSSRLRTTAQNNLMISVLSPLEADCAESVFTVTAEDPRCSELNPLQTVSRKFALRIDAFVPIIQCGFRSDSNGYGIRVIEGNTLYHYMTKTDRDGLRLINTGFSYSVDVSASLILPHGHPSKLLIFVITHSSTG